MDDDDLLVRATELGPDEVVLGLGDVVAAAGAVPVALAVVRIHDETATVTAVSAPTDALADRLAREVAALAASRGCTSVEARAGVPGRWTIEQ